MNLKPLSNRVVVEPIEPDSVTRGGIVLPEQAKEEKQRGKVLAVGPGKLLDSGYRVDPSVVVGDEVLYSKWGGSEVEVDSKTLKILSEDDLLAVVE